MSQPWKLWDVEAGQYETELAAIKSANHSLLLFTESQLQKKPF